MALGLEDKATDRLAREVASLTGETLTDAIRKALEERLERERLRRGQSARLADQLASLGRECAALPDFDSRSRDEIVEDQPGIADSLVIDTSAVLAILFARASRHPTLGQPARRNASRFFKRSAD